MVIPDVSGKVVWGSSSWSSRTFRTPDWWNWFFRADVWISMILVAEVMARVVSQRLQTIQPTWKSYKILQGFRYGQTFGGGGRNNVMAGSWILPWHCRYGSWFKQQSKEVLDVLWPSWKSSLYRIHWWIYWICKHMISNMLLYTVSFSFLSIFIFIWSQSSIRFFHDIPCKKPQKLRESSPFSPLENTAGPQAWKDASLSLFAAILRDLGTREILFAVKMPGFFNGVQQKKASVALLLLYPAIVIIIWDGKLFLADEMNPPGKGGWILLWYQTDVQGRASHMPFVADFWLAKCCQLSD